MADQITFKPSDIQPAASTPWNPGPNDIVAEIRTSDGDRHLIHGDDLAEAKHRDSSIQVLGQPQAYRDYANRTLPAAPNVTFSTLDIDKEATQQIKRRRPALLQSPELTSNRRNKRRRISSTTLTRMQPIHFPTQLQA